MNESTLVPRKEMSDLDWLARNVHVLPSGADFICIKGGAVNQVFTGGYSSCLKCDGWITKSQWLARRAELQNKPSWEDAPEWAEWMAQDQCGEWWFYDAKPCGDGCEWDSAVHSDSATVASDGVVLGSWRDTLEKRPDASEMPSHSNQPKPSTDIPECAEVKQFEPFFSAEDAKITILQSDGDVKNFGGIIGRNLLPEEDAATAKQQAPKGSGNPILGMVLADMTNRALEGKEKYGEPLLAHNGRNPLWDAYQEALDLAMYLRQAIEEQKQ